MKYRIFYPCLSRSLFLFSLFFFQIVNNALCAQNTLLPFGSDWHYYDNGNEPADQSGLRWYDVDYNSQAWPAGPAQLGYGDMDEATLISNATLTAYFIHDFVVSDPADYSQIDLQLLYDDGGVVYLNGAEIWRVNMPAGPIGYDTFALGNDGENAMASLTIDSSLLLPDTNTLAIEIHQRSSGSSDLSFDFRIEATIAGQISLARGPYLQMGRPTGMTIKWRTTNPAMSMVSYGTTENVLPNSIVDSTLKINHEIKIDSLNPNTVYFYEIASEQSVLMPAADDVYFQTSPEVDSRQKVRAWILGDPGTANNNARTVRDAYYNYIDSLHTDMILFLGDNAYVDGTDEQYQFAVFENMYEDKLKNSVAWSTLGNHDGHSADSETQTGPYYEIFTLPTNGESGGIASGTEAYYSFDYGNAHFIILDSYDSDRSIGGPMHDWCLTDLQNTMAEWIIAIWHHPAYTKGSHDSDTEGRLIDMRTNFLPILEEYGNRYRLIRSLALIRAILFYSWTL